MSVVSTDTLGAVLEAVLSPEAAPDLFVFDELAERPLAERAEWIMRDPTEVMGYVRAESHVVWTAVEAFVRRENDERRDALIEGVALLPELMHRIEDVPYRAVFLGNQGEQHGEDIRRSAEENDHDWVRAASDEYIDAFAVFVKRMSTYIDHEAKEYGFEYIEMDDKLFRDVAEEVARSLGLSPKRSAT